MSRLVIKRHQPYRPLLYFVGSALLFIVALVALVDYAEWRFLLGTMSLANEQQKAIADNLTLRKENRRLKEELEKQKRTALIDEAARQETQQKITQLHEEVSGYKREVAFYRDVFESTEAKSGPKIQGARLTTLGEPRRFQLTIALTHISSGTRETIGRVGIELQGRREGSEYEVRIPLSTVAAEDYQSDFSFKHFYLQETVLEVPEDFTPQRVKIEVFKQGNTKSQDSAIFPWSKLLR